MTIYFRNDVRNSGVDTRELKATATRLLAAVDESGSSLSITLVDDPTIQDLNREHRGKDKPTDVLSFPMYDPDEVEATRDGESERMLGDIVISVDTARKQAADYDASLQREIYRLLIHGILHVLGHDHMETEERAEMEAEERRLAAAIGMPWPYDE